MSSMRPLSPVTAALRDTVAALSEIRRVRHGCINRFFINTSSNPRNWRVDGTYKPNPDHAPKVRRVVMVEKAVVVPWSAEEENTLNRRHIAGMEFLQQIDEYRQKPKHTTAETKALLDLAERAIRKQDKETHK